MRSCSFALHLRSAHHFCLPAFDWYLLTNHPSKTVQLPERKLPLSVCLSVDDLAHCCPRCSGFLFHLSYDYGVLITSLTNDVDWHHYIVVLAGSLGMLIKEADVSRAAWSSRVVSMRWSYSLKLEHQTLFTRTLYMMFLFEHWIIGRREKITAWITPSLAIVIEATTRVSFHPIQHDVYCLSATSALNTSQRK